MPTVVTNLIFFPLWLISIWIFFPLFFDIMSFMPVFREFRDSDHLLLHWCEIISYTPWVFWVCCTLMKIIYKAKLRKD